MRLPLDAVAESGVWLGEEDEADDTGDEMLGCDEGNMVGFFLLHFGSVLMRIEWCLVEWSILFTLSYSCS